MLNPAITPRLLLRRAPSKLRCSETLILLPLAQGLRRYSTPTTLPSSSTPKRNVNKVWKTADSAVQDIKSGTTILSAGFGLCGVAGTLIEALQRRGPESLHSLTAVSNNAGAEGKGLGMLTRSGQVNRLVLSYLGGNKSLENKYLTGPNCH